MADINYDYTIATAFPFARVDSTRLTSEILASSISSTSLRHIDTNSGTCSIWFSGPISGPDQTTLDSLVAAHSGNPPDYVTASSHGVARTPTATDDSSKGVQTGDTWLDTATQNYYVCVDNTTGSATWKNTTADAVAPTRTLTAGAGMTGGGDLSVDRTFNVVAHSDGSIVVHADDVQVGVLASDTQHGSRGGGTQHSAATTSVAGFLSSTDKTKLDGVASGAQVCNWTNVSSALGGQAGANSRYLFLSNGSGGGSMSKFTPKITNRITVGQSGDDVNYTSIETAVAAAISGGASATSPWQIVVYPGTYVENPFTLIDGTLLVAADSTGVQPVYILAANSAADLITMTGGELKGTTVMGVTDPAKCLVRCATPGSICAIETVTLQACSNGLVISDGASAVVTVLSVIISAPGLDIGTWVTVTGAGTQAYITPCYLNVPSAVLPYYTGNPIQTAFRVSDGADATITNSVLIMPDNDGTSSVVLADGGSVVAFLSSSIEGSNWALHIGPSGTNTTINAFGSTLKSNDKNIKIESSTGVVYTNITVDHKALSIVAGGKKIGTTFFQNIQTFDILGAATYSFNEVDPSVNLGDFFYDQSLTGLCDGGAVTAGSGLHVNVALGEGWVRDPGREITYTVSWTAASVLLTASATNYVYYDSTTGTLVAATSSPASTGVLLATVVTSGSGIRFLHQTRILSSNVEGILQEYLLSTRQQIQKSGLGTIQGTTVRKLNIGSGSYYLGLDTVSYAGSGGDATWSYFYGTNGATEVASQTQVDITNYDNAGTLTAMTASYFRLDYLILTSDGRLSLLYGTSQYSTLPLAEAGDTASVPTFLDPSNMPLAKVIVQQGVGISIIIDARPSRSGGSSSGGGVSVHSALAGLNADDHTQYLLVSGSRAMSGDLSLGTHNITNVGTVNGVTVNSHASRHNPGGADALATGIPVAISVGATPSAGTGSSYALNDHQHGIGTGTPVAIDAANSAGTASTVARSDHVHDHGSQTTGTHHAVATGSVAGFMSTTDKTKLDGIASSAAALASTAPANVTKAAAAVGVGTTAARADHKHDITTAAAVALTVGGSNAEGSATTIARSDHTHQLPAFGSTSGTFCQGNDSRLSDDRTASGIRTATTVVVVSAATAPTSGQVLTASSGTLATWATPSTGVALASTTPANVDVTAGAVGVGTTAARADHVHQVNVGTPTTVSTTNSAGTATTLTRSDHVHAHGNQTSGTLHAVTSSTAAGFQPQSNLASAINPVAGNDTTQGYIVGSSWLNTTAQTRWVAFDVTTGAAVWKKFLFYGSGTYSNGGEAGGANRTLGNTDSYSLSLITNNLSRFTVNADGSILVTPSTAGVSAFVIKAAASQSGDLTQYQDSTGAELASFDYRGWFNVHNGITPFPQAPIFIATGPLNSYLQVAIQNQNAGDRSSSDFCATADNGDDSSYYVDLGINGSTYNDPTYSLSGASDSYLYNLNGHLAIATGSSGKTIKFGTGGTTSSNLRMTLSDTGLDLTSLSITSLADPVNAQDAATRNFVESGGMIHPACRVATTGNITLSGTQTIDGVAVVAGDRVLCKDQTTAGDRGIYVVAAGAWTRSTDFSTSAQANRGLLVHVRVGTANGNTLWQLATQPVITLGSTSLSFTEASLDSTAPANVTKATAATGTSNYLARIDHKHDVTTAAASTLSVGGSNAEGSATSLARSDHTHALPAYGSTSGTFCQGNDSRLSDDRTASGLRTATTVVSVSAATAPTSGQVLTASSGTLATWSTPLALTANTPANVTKATAVVGVGTAAARDDHKHDVSTATPSTLAAGGSNAEGTATTLARSDHVHALPAYGSTSATICQGNDSRLSDDRTASGIRTATTVVSVSAATAPTLGQVLTASSSTLAIWVTPVALTSNAPAAVTKATAAAGSGTAAARDDHKHDITTAAAITLTVGGSNAEGTATSIARSDHTHSLPAFGSTSGTFCQGSDSRLSDDRTASGIRTATTVVVVSAATAPSSGQVLTASSSTLASWATPTAYPSLTSNAPANVTKAAAAVGVGTAAARDDHKHDITTAAASTLSVGGSNAEGSATTIARSDHTHALPAFGTASGTFCQGNDSRLSDDRTASGLRSATTVVVVSAATAPSSGQVLTASSSTAASWSTPFDPNTLDIKLSVSAVSTTNIASLSGLATTVDAVALDTDGYRVLLIAQGTSSQNGIYVVHSGAWTRSADMAAGSDATGSVVFVQQGLGNAGTGWVLANAVGTAVVGTNSLTFQPISGKAVALVNSSTTVVINSGGPPSAGQALVASSSTAAGWQSIVALTSNAPVAVTKATAAVGTGTAAARDDHKHDVTTAAAVALTVGGSNAEGTATSIARSDHTHSLPAFGSGSGTFCQGNDSRLSDDRTASGIRTATTVVVVSAATAPTTGQALVATSSTLATWQTVATLTANAPAAITKATAVVGVGTAAARDDHKHDVTTAAAVALTVGGSNAEGTATSIARSDHTHSLPAFGTASGTFCQGNDSRLSDDRTASGLRSATTVVSVSAATAPSVGQALVATSSTAATWQAVAALTSNAPANVTKATAAVGTGTAAARDDHKHDVTTAAPVAIGSANAEGTATSIARSDHVHSHGHALLQQNFGPPDFDDPGADWATTVPAGMAADLVNPAILLRRFDDTTDEGVGWTVLIPVGVTQVDLTFISKAVTSPSAPNRTVGVAFKSREIPNNGGLGGWTSTALSNLNIPQNVFPQRQSITVTLAALSLTADHVYQIELVRQNPSAGTELVGDWGLIYLIVEWLP